MSNSTEHAKERIEARYQDLSREDLVYIVRAIELGKSYAKFLCPESLNKSIYKVFYQYRWINVVYDKKTKTIVTVLPGFLRQDYLRSQNGERFITTKKEVNFEVPQEWLKD